MLPEIEHILKGSLNICIQHTSKSGVEQLDKILKKLSSLIYHSNDHENASNI